MDNDTNDGDAEEFVPGYKTRDDAVAALAAAKSAQEQLKALQEEKHRMLEQMLTARDGFGDVKPAAKTEAPTLELPDPLEDRVAFAKALMQNIKQQQDATLSAAEARKVEEQRRIEAADAYLAAFNERHEDLASDEMGVFVEKAFQEVAADYRKRGVDVSKAMASAPETIMDKVATIARKKVNAVKKKLGGGDDGAAPAPGGGSAPLRAPNAPAKAEKSFVDQYKEMQRKAGISETPADW